MTRRMSMTAGGLAAIACCLLALWLLPTSDAEGALSKVEVRLVELASVQGQPGVRMRLSLANGQGVEYRVDEPRETDTVLRMIDMFVSGRSRLFVELDGNSVVRALQIAGPVGFRAP